MSETWLRCSITPGQFTGEFAVEGELYNGEGFSLFARQDDIECAEFPMTGQSASAWIRADVLDEKADLRLVRLPQSTLENGDTVTVRSGQLRTKRVNSLPSVSVTP